VKLGLADVGVRRSETKKLGVGPKAEMKQNSFQATKLFLF